MLAMGAAKAKKKKFSKVMIPNVLVDEIEPLALEMGYLSIAELVRDLLRRWKEEQRLARGE